LALLRYSQADANQGEDAMIAVNLVKADRAVGQSVNYLGSAFLGQLNLIVSRLNPLRLFRRILDETRGNATMRELYLLSDYYLDDIDVRRSVDPRADDLVRRLRIGG
jgi:hypothetical protein